MSPTLMPAWSPGPSGDTRETMRRPCTSSAATPSQGRAGPARRPVRTRSARIGFSASMGTNMLPGSVVSPAVASRTISEPMPTSFRSLSMSAAPLQFSRRRRREDRLFEQVFPVAGERPRRHDVGERHVVGAGVVDDHHGIAIGELARFAERQRRRASGTMARTSPNPVAWSYATTAPEACGPSGRRGSLRRPRRSGSRRSGSARRRR